MIPRPEGELADILFGDLWPSFDEDVLMGASNLEVYIPGESSEAHRHRAVILHRMAGVVAKAKSELCDVYADFEKVVSRDEGDELNVSELVVRYQDSVGRRVERMSRDMADMRALLERGKLS